VAKNVKFRIKQPYGKHELNEKCKKEENEWGRKKSHLLVFDVEWRRRGEVLKKWGSAVVLQPKSRRDDEPKIKFAKIRVWSCHHSLFWKTKEKRKKIKQGLQKTRFWVQESVTCVEGISIPQRPS